MRGIGSSEVSCVVAPRGWDLHTYIHVGKELFKFGVFVFESITPKQNFALNLRDFTKLEGHRKNYLSHS
jgi:hypothetical protein